MDAIVKICGLKTPETMDAAADAGADMVGLMFFERSPRNVELSLAATLAERVRGHAEIVAVTVDAGDDAISEIVEVVRPDWLQLHGHETPERVVHIGSSFPVRLMKVFGVGEKGDLDGIDRYAKVCDAFLLDAKPPKGSDRPGGLGHTFDWSLLQNVQVPVPWLLSGGLTPENAGQALEATGAPGVDVSSGVESAPGEKDIGKIRAFVAAARSVGRREPMVGNAG